MAGNKIIIITGWRYGAKTISAVMEIKNNTKLGLVKSKACIDRVLSGSEEIIEINEAADVGDVCQRLHVMGFDISLVSERME